MFDWITMCLKYLEGICLIFFAFFLKKIIISVKYMKNMKSKITNYKDVAFYIFMAILIAFIFSLVTKTVKTVEGLRSGGGGSGGGSRGGSRGGHHGGGGGSHHGGRGWYHGRGGGYYPKFYYGGSGGSSSGWWYDTPVIYVESPSWYEQFVAYIRSLFYPNYVQLNYI